MHCDPESCYSLDHAVSLCNENKVPEWPTCLEDAPIAFKRVECLPKIEAPGFFFYIYHYGCLKLEMGIRAGNCILHMELQIANPMELLKKKIIF